MGLLETIEEFLKRQKMSERCFGKLAMNDCHFISTLRRGRRAKPLTVARIEGFIRGVESML